MHNRKHLAVLAALCFSFSACQVDRIEIPEEELFTREFIKSFGIISSDQDWSVLKRASVKVSVPGSTDVRILAQIDGKTQLLAHYSGVSGSRELEFDCPKQTEYVLVKTPTNFERVPLGGEFRVGAPSRAIDGTDNVPGYTIEDGYYWGNKYVHGIYSKLPEGKASNMNAEGTVADFSFISTGKPFVFYPIFWATTGDDVLGVYWYENGEMKTQDLFSNKTNYIGESGREALHHNIYHRTTMGEDLVITDKVPADGAVDQPSDGTITIKFNREVEIRPSHQAAISSGSLSAPQLSADKKSVSYSYSGATSCTEVVFTLNGGSFVATDNKEGDLKTAMNQTDSFSFFTKDTRTSWTEVTYVTTAYNITDGLSGLITMTFDANISHGTGMVSLIGSSGASAATVGDVTVSGTTVSIPYTGASLDASYTLSIPEGFLFGDDGNSVNLTGFDRDGKNVLKTPGCKYGQGQNVELDVKPNGNNIGTEYGGSIVKEDNSYIDALIYFKRDADGKAKSKINSDQNVTFNIIGTSESRQFSYGIRTRVGSKIDGIISDENLSGDSRSLVVIKPKHDMLVSIYAFGIDTKGECPRLWHNAVDGEGYAIDIRKPDNEAAPIKYTTSAQVKANKEYAIVSSAAEISIAGLSYQLPLDEVEHTPVTYRNDGSLAGVRSRVASDSEDSGLGNHGQIPEFIKNGEKPEDHGFTRAIGTDGKPILQNDEVLTHRISFTLKEGVIFGFYLRNESGADNITNHDGITVPHTSYSLSSLNKEMDNTLFNKLSGSSASKYFTNGWGTPNEGGPDGKYHGKLNGITVPENRKYSTASTYTVKINGQEMRYFSFEDWVDYDFNDIAFMVAPESTDTEIVDNEVDTNPYIYAVEDLGATATSDIDFNDIVFAVEYVSGSDAAFVTMLAAGGTLKAHLYYKGHEIGNGFGEIVAGPHVGTDKALGHVNDWFGVDTHNVTVNVGSGGVQTGFGALTTVRIPVEEDFSLVGKLEGDISRENGFFVEVEREDGRTTQITRPDHKGEAPQMIILPGTWHWPLERVAISEAYPGGINYDGTYLPSFQEWVTNGDGNGFQKTDWYKTAKDGAVMRHAWNGSEAARDYYSKQNN